MLSSAPSTILLISPERMLRELIASHLRDNAADLSVFESASFSEVKDVPQGALIAFWHRGDTRNGGNDEVRAARTMYPINPIAIISDCHDRDLITRLFALGVNGCISTLASSRTLVHSFRMLLAGGEVVPPGLFLDFPQTSVGFSDFDPPVLPLQKPLTSMEREVLCLVRMGKPNKAIAAQLEIDESVVKGHIRNLMRKTGKHNRVELALATLRAAHV